MHGAMGGAGLHLQHRRACGCHGGKDVHVHGDGNITQRVSKRMHAPRSSMALGKLHSVGSCGPRHLRVLTHTGYHATMRRMQVACTGIPTGTGMGRIYAPCKNMQSLLDVLKVLLVVEEGVDVRQHVKLSRRDPSLRAWPINVVCNSRDPSRRLVGPCMRYRGLPGVRPEAGQPPFRPWAGPPTHPPTHPPVAPQTVPEPSEL